MYISYPHISTHIYIYRYIYNIISTDIYPHLFFASWCTPVDFVGSWEIWLQGCWRPELRRILGIAVAPRPCTMQLRTAVRRQPRSYWMWELKEMLQELMVPLRCMLLPFTDDWSRICKEHLLCTSLHNVLVPMCSNNQMSSCFSKIRRNGNLRESLRSFQIFQDVVRLLMEHGANKDRATEGGDCPVHLAARQGHLDVLRFLLEQGARLDVPAGPVCRALCAGALAQCEPTLGPNVRSFWPNSSWGTCTVCTVSLSNVFRDSLCTNLLSLMHLSRLAPMNVVCSFS